MFNSTPLYGQLFTLLRQYSRANDLRHFKTLAWMVSALIYSGQLSLPAWEPYVQKESEKSAKLTGGKLPPGTLCAKRGALATRRFLGNGRVRVSRMYVPLVVAALSGWKPHRLYIALDTTVLWDRYCMIHSSGGVLWSCGSVLVASLGA